MKTVTELHLARQGANQRYVAGAAASVIEFPGRNCAHHFASRAVPKAVQLNRLTLRAVGCLRSARSFVQHRVGVCSAIHHGSSLHAARARLGSSHTDAKKNRARRQSNNALVPTRKSEALLLAAQRGRWG